MLMSIKLYQKWHYIMIDKFRYVFLDVENLQGNNVQYSATRQTAGKIACKNGEHKSCQMLLSPILINKGKIKIK